MRRLLPTGKQMGIFAVIAVVLGAIASSGPAMECRLAVLSMPLFVVSAILGMRRNERLKLLRIATDTRAQRNRARSAEASA